MAQVRLLKIHTTGVPVEFDQAVDDITLASFTVQGGGPVLGATGLDLNNQDVSDVNDLSFNDPSTGTINQTAGALVVDNIMAKERNNVMTTAGAVLFPLVTDTAGQLDSFKVPHIAGAPTATPAFSSDAGYMVYDDTNNNMYVWDGAAWDNMNTVSSTENIDDSYIAEVAIAIRDVVYISSADNVSPADADSDVTSQAIGLATAAASATDPVNVRKFGRLAGFTGLTAGARYFLSAATAGTITSTVPVGAGNNIIQIGYAKNTTTLDIQIQILGRRAA